MTWLPAVSRLSVQEPWDEEVLTRSWKVIDGKAKNLVEGIGQGPGFEDRKTRARELLKRGDTVALDRAMIADTLLYRAVAAVWVEDQELAAQSLRRETLTAAFGESRLNRMTTNSLIIILIRDFTRLEQWETGLFEYFTQLVQRASSKITLSTRTKQNLILTVQKHPQWLLKATSPEKIARYLLKTSASIEEFLAYIGVQGISGGTYADSIRRAFYLERLALVDPAGEDPLHEELRRTEVYKAATPDGGHFGHQLMDILCLPTKAPGTMWLDTLLHIAGDPRLSHTPEWTTWWSGIDQLVREKVMGWLSAEDLRLFLAAVEEFGEVTGNEKLQRMFPARKLFLEGLFELGLIRETRLFMGTNARTFLRRRMDKHVLSDITRLTGSAAKDTSVIYVDCGQFHLVEGSHDFKLWIYYGNRAQTLIDRRRRQMSLDHLRVTVPREFLVANHLPESAATKGLRKSPMHDSVVHNGLWQLPTLQALDRLGISLPAEHLMDRDDYKEYRGRVGPTKRLSTVELTKMVAEARNRNRR